MDASREADARDRESCPEAVAHGPACDPLRSRGVVDPGVVDPTNTILEDEE
jgi:hypothetical protein